MEGQDYDLLEELKLVTVSIFNDFFEILTIGW